LLEAAQLVCAADPHVKIAVLGRGTHVRAILDRPIEHLGLRDTVLPLGYHIGDYREVLSMFDAGLMLVPGSDGSCRAALQMAAMGKPLLVAERGVLPDIVRDGETGLVVRDTRENLADAMLEMAQSPGLRRQWGEGGRERMMQHFSLDRQGRQVVAVYESVLRS
jgi:glycosyltransferase involved in cell wall biosynthesis